MVSLKTEAQLLKTWMARRADVAQRRRDGPVQALRHRRALLERELPRLELEVAHLEKAVARAGVATPPVWTAVRGLVRGGALAFAALLWVAGVVVMTPAARGDDPARLGAMVLLVAMLSWGKR